MKAVIEVKEDGLAYIVNGQERILCADQAQAWTLAEPTGPGIYPIPDLQWEVVAQEVQISHGFRYNEVAILKESTPSKPTCCGVPMDLHGTCCGWENAIAPCTTEFIIADKRHPGFGQHLNRWKNSYLDGSEDSYDITEKSSFASGWDAAINALRESTPSTEQESQEAQTFTLEDMKASFEAGRIADSWSEEIGWTTHHTFNEWIKTRKP